MMSGPDSGLNKQQKNRFTLKAAVAALALAGAVPADAQTAPATETLQRADQSDEIADEVTKEIASRRALMAKYIKQNPRNTDLVEMFAKFDQRLKGVETLLPVPQYRDGLKILQGMGGHPGDFVRIDPKLIMDHAELHRRYEKIPEGLRGHIRFTARDLVELNEREYEIRSGTIELAKRLSSHQILLSVDDLDTVLRASSASPHVIDLITRLHDERQGVFSGHNLARIAEDVARNRINASSFENDAFIEGYARLIGGGVEGYKLTGLDMSEADRSLLETRVADPAFVSLVLGLEAAGYEYSYYLIRLPDDILNSPLFLQNAQTARTQIQGLGTYHLVEYSNAFTVPNFQPTLAALPAETRRFALGFIHTQVNDPAAWGIIHRVVLRHSGDKAFSESFLRLDAARISDPIYMEIFEHIFRSENPPREMNPWSVRNIADRKYFERQTGEDMLSVTEDLNKFLSLLRDPQGNPIIKEMLEAYTAHAFKMPVLRMNQLHDDVNPQRRLEVLKDMNAQTIFGVITLGGEDAWLSTARLLYNGNGYTGEESKNSFLSRVRSEHGSLPAFFRAVRPDHKVFGTFLEFLSQNDILDKFLSDVGTPEEQQTMLREYLFDSTAGITGAQALTLSDLLHTTKSEDIRSFVFEGLRSVQSGQLSQKNRGPEIAGLIIADYFQGRADAPAWAHGAIQEFGKYFPVIRDLSEQTAFRKEGNIERNVQVHLFYDDRAPGKPESAWDGHGSFRNFITSLGGSVAWDKEGTIQRITVGRGYTLQDNGDYITIRQADGRTKREIVMYVNKPDRNDETVERVDGELIKTHRPQVVVHRGHSYHAGKTIRLLDRNTAMVNLGSCGGAKNIADVLAKAPAAQVMATRGVGTMLVNDTVIPAINGALLKNGGISWERFRSQMTAEFKRRGGTAEERWGSYQTPEKNRIAHLIAALKAFEK